MDWFSFVAGSGFTIVASAAVFIGFAALAARMANMGDMCRSDARDAREELDVNDPKELNRILQQEAAKFRPYEDQFTNL